MISRREYSPPPPFLCSSQQDVQPAAQQDVQPLEARQLAETRKRENDEASEAVRTAAVNVNNAQEEFNRVHQEIRAASEAVGATKNQFTTAVKHHRIDDINALRERLNGESKTLFDKTELFNERNNTLSAAHGAYQAALAHSNTTTIRFTEATQKFTAASMKE